MQIPVRHAHPFRKDQGHFFFRPPTLNISETCANTMTDSLSKCDGKIWKGQAGSLIFWFNVPFPRAPQWCLLLVTCPTIDIWWYIYIYSKIYKYLKIYVYLFISTINQRIPTHTSMYIFNIFWGSSPCGYSNDKQPQSCYKTCVRSKPPPFFTPNCGCVTVSLRHTMAFFHGTYGFYYSQNLVDGNSYREPWYLIRKCQHVSTVDVPLNWFSRLVVGGGVSKDQALKSRQEVLWSVS